MALGMSKEEYWYGSPMDAFDYVLADRERQRRANENAWLQGMYFYDAVSVALTRSFSEDRSNLPSYPDNPYDIFNENEAKRKEAEAKRAEAYMQSLLAWGKQFNGEK